MKTDLKNTLDNLLEGFQIIDFDWRYIYVNDALCRHAKYRRDELIGFTVKEKFPGIEKAAVYEVYLRCFNERIALNMENEFTFPDGSVGWFDLRFEPIPEGIFILSIDITEKKLAEKEILNYMKGLEEMIFMTSHRLRQPITQILGISDLFDETEYDQEVLGRMAGYMKRSAETLDIFSRELTSFINEMRTQAV